MRLASQYCYLGSFGRDESSIKGISAYEYNPDEVSFKFIMNCVPEMSVGQQVYNKDTSVLYCVDEVADQPGRTGGGGNVVAFKVNREDGTLTEMNRACSLSNNPCYLSVTDDSKYLLVTHHGTFSHITTISKDENGEFCSKVSYDTASVVLFSLNEDGSLGRVSDVCEMLGDDSNGKNPLCHLHSVLKSPDGKWFVVNDKGQNSIYTFKVDEGKLVLSSTLKVKDNTAPRYGFFSEKVPVFYENREREQALYVYDFSSETGKLTEKQRLELDPENIGQPCDFAYSPDKDYFYMNSRNPNVIYVFHTSEDGTVSLVQKVEEGLDAPRGMCISPDGKYLLCTNMRDGEKSIVAYSIGDRGVLSLYKEVSVPCGYANIQFI